MNPVVQKNLIAYQDTRLLVALCWFLLTVPQVTSTLHTYVEAQIDTPGTLPGSYGLCAPVQSPPGPCTYKNSCPAGKLASCCDIYTATTDLGTAVGTQCMSESHSISLSSLTLPRFLTDLYRRECRRRRQFPLHSASKTWLLRFIGMSMYYGNGAYNAAQLTYRDSLTFRDSLRLLRWMRDPGIGHVTNRKI